MQHNSINLVNLWEDKPYFRVVNELSKSEDEANKINYN